jgi:hypothetical protein
MVFTKPMKTKITENQTAKGLHEADEDQNSSGIDREWSS